MARPLFMRVAVALVAAVPTSLLYLSTVLNLPFHLSALGYEDEVATLLIDYVLYITCAVYAMLNLLLWTWFASHRALARQLFTLPRLSGLSRPLTFFFLVLLPAVLVAAQVVQNGGRYRALFLDGDGSLEVLLAVAFDLFAAFCACAQLWFGVALQVQLFAFESGQDMQRFTKKLYFLYSPSSSAASDSTSSSSSLRSSSASSTSLDSVLSIADENEARKKAYELSMDPTYAGFAKSVMSLDEFNANALVQEGALGVVFVVDPFACRGVGLDETTAWLNDEAALRAEESAQVGPLKNIVYTSEGTRRVAFLRVKFAVYALLPPNASTLAPPPADIPRYIDEWLGQFGAHRLLPLAFGGATEDFARWKAELGHTLGASVVNPRAKSPLVRKRFPEPYMGWFDFLHWLDACSDASCARYHRYEVEKLRERPSRKQPRFVDYVWWFFTSRHGPTQLERRYAVFGPANRRTASSVCGVVAACLATFLPLRLHYVPDVDPVAFFSAFTGLTCFLYFLWAVLHDYLRHSSSKKSKPKSTSEKAGPTFNPVQGLSVQEEEEALPSPSAGTVLAPKYHYHTNVDHYHQEVRDKQADGGSSGEDGPDVPMGSPYSPLPDSAPLLRVPYTCPLFDSSAAKGLPDPTFLFGADSAPLFDEEFESHDQLLPPVFGGEKDLVRWRPKAVVTSGGAISEEYAIMFGAKAKEVSPDALGREALFVNPTFEYQAETTVPFYAQWSEEFLHKHLQGEPIVLVRMPGTGLPLPYQLSDAKERAERARPSGEENNDAEAAAADQERVAALQRLFASLKPGLPIPQNFLVDHDTSLLQKLIQSEIIVSETYWRKRTAYFRQQNERARHELQTLGYTVLRNLLPKRHLNFMRRYYRRLFSALGGQPAADKYHMQKTQWNDEPSARFINHHLTAMIREIVEEPVLHPGLALSIWILKGEGFPLHRDSSPPFDLTLDLVLDHVGSQPRPVTFIRRRQGLVGGLLPGVEEHTLSLGVGEAVLFRGGEMPHFGGDLGESNYHNVLLWTWSYVRD